MDALGALFVTMTCDIEGGYSEVFLAAEVQEGIKTLEDPQLRFPVIVSDCHYSPWTLAPKLA